MSLPLSSDQVQELIAGYVLGDLTPDEMVAFEKLLADYPEVTPEIAAMQQTLEVCFAPVEVAPPAALRTAILAAASQPMPLSRLTPLARSSNSSSNYSSQPVPLQRMAWGRVAGLAAAALILALGLANYRLWQTLQSLQANRPDASSFGAPLTYTLQGTEMAQTATATIVVNPATLEATLTVNQLPSLPISQVYVLWTVVEPSAPFTTDQKNAILTQVFRVGDQGHFSGTIAVPAAYRNAPWVIRLAVTVEEAAAPQAHQGAIALSTAL